MTEKDPIWCWGRSVLQKKTDDDGSSGGLTQPILLSNQTHTKHVENINDEWVQDLAHLRKQLYCQTDKRAGGSSSEHTKVFIVFPLSLSLFEQFLIIFDS